MRKTRVLAALLCLMMIATAIPMMQTSATETDAGLNAVLGGATEKYTVDFASYNNDANDANYVDAAGKHVTAGDTIYWYSAGADLARLSDGEGGTTTDMATIKANGGGLFCRDEKFLEDSSLTGQGADNVRLSRVEVTAEGLAVRAGNKADSGSDNVIPGPSGENNGWKWDDTNAEDNYHLADGKLDVNMGYAGAMLFKLKLDKEGSSAEVLLRDGANGETQVGFVVSNAGVQMKYASNYAYGDAATSTDYDQYAQNTSAVAGPALTTGTWYEILFKNNFNRYTIYVREAGTGAFTEVVTGTAKYGNNTPSPMKQLMMYSLYNTNGSQATKLVTKDGAQKQYLASYVESEGWEANVTEGITAIADGQDTRPLSQVTFASVTTYEDSDNSGMTLQEALGQNAVATAKYEATADNAALISGGMALANWGLHGTPSTNGGDVIVEKGKVIQSGLAALSVDTAIEFGVKIPENATGAINLRGNTNISNARLYADFGGAGGARGRVFLGAKTNAMRIENLRNIATDARTFLLTIDNTDGTNYMKLWAKHPGSGKYLYLGKTVMKDGNGGCWPRLENYGDAAYTITSFAVYNKNGLAESAVLPEGAEDLYKYVNADMDTQPSNFVAGRGGEESIRGDLAFVEGILDIKLPTGSTGAYTHLLTNNAFIPKGGYAEVGFKTYPKSEFRFETRDGEKHFFVALKPNNITATNSTAVNGTVNGGYNMDPNTWMDMRVVRSVDDKFSVYLKKAGENGWTRVVTDAAPTESTASPLMQIGGYGTADTNRETDAHSLDYLYVYGPKADQPMVVLDGKANEYVTVIPAQGATLTRGAQAVIAPNVAGKVIFAGYKGTQLIAAEQVTVTSEDEEQVFAPTTLTSDDIDTIRVFLWKEDGITPHCEAGNFAK